jgi:ATP-dependent DNA helicase DinG
MRSEVQAALARVVSRLPGGAEARPGQVKMALAVAECLEEGRHLAVWAGTGTGKSLAYLVPAALSGKRVVIATATKALQDQLGEKDLPLVASALPERHLRFALLKGRSNYLCVQRLEEAKLIDDSLLAEMGAEGDREQSRLAEQAATISAWAATTSTGERAELADEPDPRVWSGFSVSADACPGASRCPSGERCFAEQARSLAAEADLVVVNLHLLGADVAAGGGVLPEHDALIVDEAHALEDVLTESLGRSIGAARVRALAAAARAALGGARRASAGRGVLEDLGAVADRLDALLGARSGERVKSAPQGELGDVLGLLSSRLERLEAVLGRRLDLAESDGAKARDQKAARAALVAGRLREDLAALASLGQDDVAWIEGGPRPSLVVAPIEVGAVLEEQVFSKMPVVLTSATMPSGMPARLGAGNACVELEVASPFAYEERAVLYCAAHLPDRRQSSAETAIHDELVALIEAAGGRTLALFTSRAAMERAAAAVQPRVGFPLLVQGSAGKQALLSAFSADPEACLFATMGFWQGVDVAGPTLSCVVIDRIPFPRPDDPLVSARRERAGPQAFWVVDLPRAASLLAQGAGRLIRTASDRGVVAVLDSRLATASYRWKLVRALPPMRRTRERAEAEAFLRLIDDEASTAQRAPLRPSQ